MCLFLEAIQEAFDAVKHASVLLFLVCFKSGRLKHSDVNLCSQSLSHEMNKIQNNTLLKFTTSIHSHTGLLFLSFQRVAKSCHTSCELKHFEPLGLSLLWL